jgi:hypothetical protein
LLSSLNSSDQDKDWKISSEWWFKLGKSSLSFAIVSFDFLLLLTFFGILNLFLIGELGVLESESELFAFCVEESESEELEKSGVMNLGLFLPVTKYIFIVKLFQFF